MKLLKDTWYRLYGRLYGRLGNRLWGRLGRLSGRLRSREGLGEDSQEGLLCVTLDDV